ncbi:putative non-specific serine/threonine protein kinase [Rosa chinensis]|uniref:Putative non-specific serine/threonine protein kinase n=1 Tax=Rosa chinensis TaxID=74649 RepID=A0A2P6S790_ROSCH|nr:putative non-specific serine/threonine protein kinase [Rosa chinensis]
MLCMKNCSCTAYANSNIREGRSGRLLWLGDLIDLRNLAEKENGQDIHIRLAASEQDNEETNTRINAKPAKSNVKKVRIVASTLVLSTGRSSALLCLEERWKTEPQPQRKSGITIV